jgi:CheY-like chemotaxis protein
MTSAFVIGVRHDQPRSMRPPEAHERSPWHVVVVDRAPDSGETVRTVLQDSCCLVTTSNVEPTTFDRIAMLQPALMVVDLTVGHQDGWALLAELHREPATRDIPVVVVSTSARLLEAARDHRTIWGGDGYLLKPLDMSDLRRAIADLTR